MTPARRHDDAPMADGATPRLTLRGVACARGDRLLFEALDLDLAAGDIVWLRAPNGFGKTTLLRTIVGLSKPERGTVDWSSDDPAPLYLGHANALKDDLGVAESVRHLLALQGIVKSPDAIGAALRDFGLFARRRAPIRTLSQGQRRRVALTRLALSRPDAPWILDEPFEALDADGVARVAALIAAHASSGGSVLFTSHVAPGTIETTARVVQLDGAR